MKQNQKHNPHQIYTTSIKHTSSSFLNVLFWSFSQQVYLSEHIYLLILKDKKFRYFRTELFFFYQPDPMSTASHSTPPNNLKFPIFSLVKRAKETQMQIKSFCINFTVLL